MHRFESFDQYLRTQKGTVSRNDYVTLARFLPKLYHMMHLKPFPYFNGMLLSHIAYTLIEKYILEEPIDKRITI